MAMGHYSNAKRGLIRVFKWSLIAVGWLVGAARAHYFHAPLEVAQWEVESSQFRCVLSHSIADYGVVRFISTSGDGLWFEVEPKDKPTQSGQASIAIRGPEWKSNVKPRQVTTVDFALRDKPVVVRGETARLLLSELSAGMSPTLEHPGLYSSHPIHVEVLPVRLWPALRKFRSCQARLFEDSILRAKRLNVNFAFDSYQLNVASRAQLDKLVELLSLDPTRYELVVRGHTDNRGDNPYNDRLSHKRALAVKTYLDLKKVPRSTLEVKYYGETKPLVPNDTEGHRLLNRRVEVILREHDRVRESIEEAVAKLDTPASSQSATENPGEGMARQAQEPSGSEVPETEVELEPTLLGEPKDLSDEAVGSEDEALTSADDVGEDSNELAQLTPGIDDQAPAEGDDLAEDSSQTPIQAIPYEESGGQSREPLPGKIWAR